MKVYFVVPPKGVVYKASALAQLDFEEGHEFLETGYADLDEETGTWGRRVKYAQAKPVRYSEEDKVFGLIWSPGRLVYLKFEVPPLKRHVSPELGRQRGESMVTHRETKSNEDFLGNEQVRNDKAILRKQERITGGWWVTSGGFKVRPFYLGERMNLLRFPYLVYGDRNKPGMGSEAADREVRRWYSAAMKELYNPYASTNVINLRNGNNDIVGTRADPSFNPDDGGRPSTCHLDKAPVGQDFRW